MTEEEIADKAAEQGSGQERFAVVRICNGCEERCVDDY